MASKPKGSYGKTSYYGLSRPIAPNRSRYPGAPEVRSTERDWTAVEGPPKREGKFA
jgi:hypothetical protein